MRTCASTITTSQQAGLDLQVCNGITSDETIMDFLIIEWSQIPATCSHITCNMVKSFNPSACCVMLNGCQYIAEQIN